MIEEQKALQLITSGEILFVDLRFTDIRGAWQHMTMTAHEFTPENIKKGFGFDGSSIKGFNSIFESDMLLMPDMETPFLDPFYEKTLIVICDVYDPITREPFERDPRYTAKKAEAYLKKTGVGTISYWGPEIEFFVFDKLAIGLHPHNSFINIESSEIPDFPQEGHDGYKIMTKSGYFPTPPFDKLQAFRSEMVTILESIGITVEVHHHEVATGGQVEIDMRYGTLVATADNVMKYKYVARNVAKKYGMTATFLPKPIAGDNGSGMHTHQSIFKAGKNVFFDPKGYAELSKPALSYAAGLLSHLRALLGITNSTLSSYRRLVPHYEAPTAIAFSKRNRSAAVRVPMYFMNDEKSKRLELRCPDPTTNPYLSFSAQLVFGLDGIAKKLDPTKEGFGPFEENIWEKSRVKQTPQSLVETLGFLRKDKTLVESGVFAQSLLTNYLDIKTTEMRESLLYPTPADFWFNGDL
ncbi:MAG: type I glutamate--ammonia ligase [Patescibacteria group bacterium]